MGEIDFKEKKSDVSYIESTYAVELFLETGEKELCKVLKVFRKKHHMWKGILSFLQPLT